MTEAQPAVYTIPPGVAFVDALARGLYARAEGDPLALSGMTVLLPTRRACRSLREAFLRLGEGRAMLLPRMVPLGDVDAEELLFAEDSAAGGGLDVEVPPAMDGLRRQLLLTRLIGVWGKQQAERTPPTVDQAAELAAELARLLDQVETEGLSFDRLEGLVQGDHAAHWQVTLEFLKIVTEWWPKIEADEGAIGPAARRRLLMRAQGQAWRAAPPEGPVIAAGSTGSIPATAELLDVVARLPNGCVVLPGLDTASGEDAWAEVSSDPTHPQHGMAHLLESMGLARDAVAPWPYAAGSPTAPARADTVAAALAPAGATAGWRELAEGSERERLELGLRGVRRLDCPGPGEEATAIALMLRHALEKPERTAALVTPDRSLARRVAAELRRWDVQVDDSAGVPLAETPPGAFLRLTARMLAEGLAPLSLLAALKHPLAAGGEEPGAFKAKVRALEIAVLRGVRPASGFEGLLAALDGKDEAARLRPWLEGLRAMAAEAEAALQAPEIRFDEAVNAQMRFAEALAATPDEPGAARLWRGEAGEEAAALAAALLENAEAAPALPGSRYPALLDTLMQGRVVRPPQGGHPRLAIWGPLEARLQRADLMILGGLNEGTWPAETDPGPWLSRPMRGTFGLPPVERRIGLMAHDFVQAFAAPEIVLTRATRIEGTPTVASRWLLRLDALLESWGLVPLEQRQEADWLHWAAQLDAPTRPLSARERSARRPAPTPPLAARPRKLPVTRIETWLRDPYALYADRILGLRPLDAIDQDPGAAERGTLLHGILEAFVKAHPERLPADPEAELLRLGEAAFAEQSVPPGLRAFWWPRFRRIARWFAEVERNRRADGRKVLAERRGSLLLDGMEPAFELVAKADRIERLPDGRLALIDYKTGTVPKNAEILHGKAPQLPLEAAMVTAGAFPDIPGGLVAELAHWEIKGGRLEGKEHPVTKADPAALAGQALDSLCALIRQFDDPQTPYWSRPRPGWLPRYDDYGHLARVQEWSAGGTGDEG